MLHCWKTADQDCLLVYIHTPISWLDGNILSEMWSLSLKSEHPCIIGVLQYWWWLIGALYFHLSWVVLQHFQWLRAADAGKQALVQAGVLQHPSMKLWQDSEMLSLFPKLGLYLAIGARSPKSLFFRNQLITFSWLCFNDLLFKMEWCWEIVRILENSQQSYI